MRWIDHVGEMVHAMMFRGHVAATSHSLGSFARNLTSVSKSMGPARMVEFAILPLAFVIVPAILLSLAGPARREKTVMFLGARMMEPAMSPQGFATVQNRIMVYSVALLMTATCCPAPKKRLSPICFCVLRISIVLTMAVRMEEYATTTQRAPANVKSHTLVRTVPRCPIVIGMKTVSGVAGASIGVDLASVTMCLHRASYVKILPTPAA